MMYYLFPQYVSWLASPVFHFRNKLCFSISNKSNWNCVAGATGAGTEAKNTLQMVVASTSTDSNSTGTSTVMVICNETMWRAGCSQHVSYFSYSILSVKADSPYLSPLAEFNSYYCTDPWFYFVAYLPLHGYWHWRARVKEIWCPFHSSQWLDQEQMRLVGDLYWY